jgi:hypothetical protein
MIPSNGKLVLPNIYEMKQEFYLKRKSLLKKKIQPLRQDSNFSNFSNNEKFYKISTHEPILFTEQPENGGSSFDSMTPLILYQSATDKQVNTFKKNNSVLKESRFSIRNNSLPKKTEFNEFNSPLIQKKKFGNNLKSKNLKNKKNGFIEKKSRSNIKKSFNNGKRKRIELEPLYQFKPFGEYNQNKKNKLLRFMPTEEMNEIIEPKRKSRQPLKENLKNKYFIEKQKLKRNKSIPVDVYCKEVFRHAFREIDSIFYLFANLHEIGSGSYAVAYSAIEKKTGKKYVLKTFKLKDFVKKSYVNRFMVRISLQFKFK